MDFAPLLDAATSALRDDLGRVDLADPIILKQSHRSVTVRCTATSSRYSPRSVVIKRLLEDPACGYSDWASHAFLTGLRATAGLAPRFLAGDQSSGVFVLEDLGAGANLDSLFATGDDGLILPALHRLGAQMATLHAATWDQSAAFDAHRKPLPGALDTGRHREAVKWLHAREKWMVWLDALELTAHPGFDAAAKALAELFARPGPWLAFTHGDPAPSNNQFRGEKSWLLDFEYGAFRHALYDITAWQTLCPLPHRWLTALMGSFREVLLTSRPQLELDLEAHWAAVCLYRAWAILSWIPISVLHQDQSWVGEWAARQALLAASRNASAASASFPEYAGLSVTLGDLAHSLEDRWPEAATLPPTPWS